MARCAAGHHLIPDEHHHQGHEIKSLAHEPTSPGHPFGLNRRSNQCEATRSITTSRNGNRIAERTMNVPRLASGDDPLPGWARATDFVAVLLAIMAVTIAASGGMRVELWDRHVNLTSPIRVLLWAAALVVVRHVIARDHPMYRHLAAQAAAWARSV